MSDNQSTVAPVPYQDAAVAPPPEVVAPSSGGGGLLAMIERLATRNDLNIDVFERLLAARRAEEDRAAMRAFNNAMSNAKGEIGPVLKTRDVDYPSSKGSGRVKYKYENFADVARAVDPVFSRHGLSYRFRVAQAADVVKVTCIVSHSDGYSEENSPLESRVDPGSTGMSMVQALGSALTYLQRYSLRSAIGLPAGVDDDGRGAGGTSPKISVEQANELQKLIDAVGGRTGVTLLKLYNAEAVTDLTTDQFTAARDYLGLALAERKRNAPAGN